MWRSLLHIVSLFLIIIIINIVAAASTYFPLPQPILCNSTACTVHNYQGIWADRQPCKAAQAFYPSSEEQLFQAVALASKTASKIKVLSKGSHSFSKLVCPGGEHGILISTQHYHSPIHVNLSSLRVTAHAGVMLGDLLATIAEYGLALPHTPIWQGVSVAGLISTGAHGSGMWGKGSALHDYVVGMRLIIPTAKEDGYARIVDLHEDDDDLNAARLSLGVLGAISTVTFQLEPMFKRSVRLEVTGDESLDSKLLQFAKEHEFGEISWYLASGKVLLKLDDRVSVETDGEGAYNFAGFGKLEVDRVESLRNQLEAAEQMQSFEDFCREEAMAVSSRQSSGGGLVNHGNTFTGYPVIGLNHKMQSSGGCEEEEHPVLPVITPTGMDFRRTREHPSTYCSEDAEPDKGFPEIPNTHCSEDAEPDKGFPEIEEDHKLVTCMWNPLIKGVFHFHTSISIPASMCKDAIADIKKLRDVDPMRMCSMVHSGGIWIRFLSSSKAYLGESTDAAVFEMMYYRARDPNTPRLHEDVFEEIEQMLLHKFGGRPHWGKNRNLAFENMHTRTRAMEKFLEVRQRYDPSGLFSSEWTDAILGTQSSARGVQTFQEHCALEGLCVCKEDSHCHPAKGYYCRPGRVYKEARVCAYDEKQGASFM